MLLLITGMAIALAALLLGIGIGSLTKRAKQDVDAANARAAQIEGWAQRVEASQAWKAHTLN